MANDNSDDTFKKSEELNKQLEQLSAETGIPVPELIRRALSLYAISDKKPTELENNDQQPPQK